MSLKHDVLISNKFASKYHLSAHQGKTPGRFVTDYAARPSATEPLFLSNKEINDRYWKLMMIDSAHRSHYSNPKSRSFESTRFLSKQLIKYRGLDGRTFSSNSVSLTQNQLLHGSRLIQHLFNRGHSVQKLVVSFTLPYLKERGLVDKNFKMYRRGSSFGQVDQLKARIAVTDGLNAMTKHAKFRNPYWIAAFQFDTRHVHCHIVGADNCPLRKSRRLVPYKEQGSDVHYKHLEDRGKIRQSDKDTFRHNTDFSLQEMYSMGVFHSQPSLMHQDIMSRVDFLTSRQFNVNSYLQELMDCLPKKRKLWRYPSKNRLMRRPNELMQGYIHSLVRYHGSYIGYDHSLDVISRKAKQNKSSRQPYRVLYRNGVNSLNTSMANTVYDQLKSVSPRKMNVQTTFLDDQSYDRDSVRHLIAQSYHGKHLKNGNSLMSMYRLYSYEDRYSQAVNDFAGYSRALDGYDDRQHRHETVKASRPLRSYYTELKQYNAQRADKYRKVLPDRDLVNPREKQRMEKRRKSLVIRYNALRKKNNISSVTVRDRHLLDMPRTISFLHSHDRDVKQLLDYRKRGWSAPLGEIIKTLVDHRNSSMPRSISYTLPIIEQTYPQFKGMRYELKNRNRIVSTTYIKPSRDKYRYSQDLTDFTDEAFEDRLVNSRQLIDRNQAWQGNLVKPPKLLVPSVTRSDYERVKGTDLQDCLYDFNPGEPRNLSPNTLAEFSQSANNRYNSLHLAMPYIKFVHQQHRLSDRQYNDVNNLYKSLKQTVALSDHVNRTHRMPINVPLVKINNQHKERNLVTFNIPTAHHYMKQDLVSLGNDNRNFIRELDKDPQGVLGVSELSESEKSAEPSKDVQRSESSEAEPSDTGDLNTNNGNNGVITPQ